jgi:hypothetical protein
LGNAGRRLSNPGENICKTSVRLRQEFLEKYHRIADPCFPIQVVFIFVRTIADPEALEESRRDWCLGGEAFRKELRTYNTANARLRRAIKAGMASSDTAQTTIDR